MNFLSSIATKLSDTFNLSSNFSVVEVSRSMITQFELLTAVDNSAKFYKAAIGRDVAYTLILTVHGAVPKYLRLFLLSDMNEATDLFNLYSTRVIPIAVASKHISSSTSKMQDLCNRVRANPHDSVVHDCVKLGLAEALKRHHPEMARNVNQVDENNRSALIVACMLPEVADEIVQELLSLGADVSLADSHKDTAFHFAAKYSSSKLTLLLSRPSEAINYMTIFGETPLHVACSESQSECVQLLLQHGADPRISESYKLPVHCAVKANSIECIKLLAESRPELLDICDGKFGGTALHWARTREAISCLIEGGAKIDALSNTRDTPLHIMLKEDRRDCVNILLTSGADVSLPNHEAETPLHIAIPTDDLAMVRSLVVFGADVNMKDRNGITPRHMTATQKTKNSGYILYTLHMIGAARCEPGRADCNEGCAYGGKYKGTKVSNIDNNKEHIDNLCDEIMTAGAVLTHRLSDNVDGHRVLCLDGGGIRGLILSMILVQLEKLLGQSIKDSFDWISGTSTGGILALALVYGRNARYCLGLYFRLKNKVFCGSKPYSCAVFESILKNEFGEGTLMSDLPYPRVLITSVLADRFPPDLHFFRNYENPMDDLLPSEKRYSDQYPPPPKPNEVCIWQAARSSGAAPTFFKASMDRFLDGGLMSNNPTVDTITEITEFNTAIRALGHPEEAKPIKCVLSLGTGRIPITSVNDIDVYRPSGLFDAYKVVQGATSLIKLLVEQATQSEGRPNERARAWCSSMNAPYFRLSPQLSVDVQLDENDDDKLLLICWETMVYIKRNHEKLVQIATVLKQCKQQPT